MLRITGILLLTGFFHFATAQHSVFDPGHIGCACHKKSSHLRLEKGLKSSGQELNQYYHRFEWFVDPNVRYIKGSVTSQHVMNVESDMLSFDLSSALSVDSVIYHGNHTGFQHSNDVLTITLPASVPAGATDSVSIFYQGVPPVGSGFGSFVQGSHAGIPILWTLSQPYGCSDWWPCKNGLTDKIDSIDIIVTSPLPHRTASNGLLVNEWVENGHRTCHWRHRYPIVPYLIAIAVTDYAIYSDWVPHNNDSIEVLNYVFPGQLETVHNQTPGLIPIMQLFNELLEPYPFILERYGHAQFGWGGGMEHQTMSFMGNFGHELMAHELAHSWFGNKITTGSWEDIWVNEGFATYLTGLTYEHMFDGYYWPIWKELNINSVTSQAGGSVWVDDTTSVSRIFNSRLSYRKGALILHTLRWIIGDDDFFQAMRNMLSHPSHAYGYIRTQDVIGFFEEASGRDLGWYFDQWYYGQGYPTYVVHYDLQSGTQATVTIYQAQSHTSVEFFNLPVPLLLSGEGQDTLLVLDNAHNVQSFEVDPGFIPDSIMFDPEMWLITRNSQVVIGINEPESKNLLKIFPNPAGDLIFIEGADPIEEIVFTGTGGEVVRAKKFRKNSGWLYMAETSQLSAGLWIVQVQTGQRVVHKKLVIVR
jgi:aminopeptidase N